MTGCGASPTPFFLKHPSVSKATAHVPFAPLNKAGGKKKMSENTQRITARFLLHAEKDGRADWTA